jgi:hypothetical protein
VHFCHFDFRDGGAGGPRPGWRFAALRPHNLNFTRDYEFYKDWL